MKKLLIGAVVPVLAVTGWLAVPHKSHADFDLPGLNQQVQNHEARITNAESNIQQLQQSTNTPPAASPVPVPPPPSPSPSQPATSTQPTTQTVQPNPTPPAPTVDHTTTCRTTVTNGDGSHRYTYYRTTYYSDGSHQVNQASSGDDVVNPVFGDYSGDCPGNQPPA